MRRKRWDLRKHGLVGAVLVWNPAMGVELVTEPYLQSFCGGWPLAAEGNCEPLKARQRGLSRAGTGVIAVPITSRTTWSARCPAEVVCRNAGKLIGKDRTAEKRK